MRGGRKAEAHSRNISLRLEAVAHARVESPEPFVGDRRVPQLSQTSRTWFVTSVMESVTELLEHHHIGNLTKTALETE